MAPAGKPRRVTLRRSRPPFLKRVVVHPFTVAAFLRYNEVMAEVAYLVKRTKMVEPNARTMRANLTLVRRLQLADIACPEEPCLFFLGWDVGGNFDRVLDAVMDNAVNDWPAYRSVMSTEAKPRKAGSVEGDIQKVCQFYPGKTPGDVLAWPMSVFVFTVRGIEKADEKYEPSSDQDAEPAPIDVLGRIPGVAVVH